MLWGAGGASLAVSAFGGRGAPGAWRGGPGGSGESGCPPSWSVSAPRASELSLPLPSLFGRCRSGAAATAERRAVRGGGGEGEGGKSGRALRILRGKIFPTAGHGEVNFSPAVELVLFPRPWGDRFKKRASEPPSNLFLSLFRATGFGEVWL